MFRWVMAASMALFAACGMFESDAEVVMQQQLMERISAGEEMLILDVRTTGEYSEGFIANAVNIDHRDIESRIDEITAYRDKPVIVYCYSGMRAAMVESLLIEKGFSRVQHLEGDWSGWREAGLPFSMP